MSILSGYHTHDMMPCQYYALNVPIMYRYYVQQSTSPAELPDWLFPERQQHYTRAWAHASPTRSTSQQSFSSSSSYAKPVTMPRLTSDGPHSSTSKAPAYSRQPGQLGGENRIKDSIGQENELGSRTALKLRQMKSAKNVRSL